MTIFSWKIDSLSTLSSVDDHINVVVNAKYTLIGTQGTIIASMNGSSQFNHDRDNFIPFNDLNENQVIEWVKITLGNSGIQSMEAYVQGQIDYIINPPISPIQQPLPWV